MGEGIRGDSELSDSTGRIIEWQDSEFKSIGLIIDVEGKTNSCGVDGILKMIINIKKKNRNFDIIWIYFVTITICIWIRKWW